MIAALTKTLKVRVRGKHGKALRRQAAAVNFVWNYVNELSSRNIREHGVFLSAYDIHPYTKGAGKDLGLHSQTLQVVAKEYVTRRNQFHKQRLALRKTYGLSQHRFKTASFTEDARGRWYFNVAVEIPKVQSAGTGAVGIDLGCKDAATCSTGDKLDGRWYRDQEHKLPVAQRAHKKQRAQAIHAKIANRREDAMHKFSRVLVDHSAAVFVGNVNARAIARTQLSKSSLDAGCGMLKTMLEYKCEHAGIVFEEVNEAYTTQTCSCCGAISDSSPKGRAGLGIREWTCGDCGERHDRDTNAARKILAAGHSRLAGGILHQNAV